MKAKEIQDLIDFIAKTGLDEVNIETEQFKLNVKRSSAGRPVDSLSQPVQPPALPPALRRRPCRPQRLHPSPRRRAPAPTPAARLPATITR
jgi:acetyl-CoA carboxylase biotin carboxyl carrier protein